MDFCSNMKRYRKIKKISQTELAKILGVGRTTITKWESGENTPGIDVLDKLADILETSADDLLGRDPVIDRYRRNEQNVKLLKYYSQLNDIGKNEAVKRVSELTMIHRYTNTDMPIAAHNDKRLDDAELDLMRQDIDDL